MQILAGRATKNIEVGTLITEELNSSSRLTAGTSKDLIRK